MLTPALAAVEEKGMVLFNLASINIAMLFLIINFICPFDVVVVVVMVVILRLQLIFIVANFVILSYGCDENRVPSV